MPFVSPVEQVTLSNENEEEVTINEEESLIHTPVYMSIYTFVVCVKKRNRAYHKGKICLYINAYIYIYIYKYRAHAYFLLNRWLSKDNHD
jgi:hypothetical protein